VPGGGSGQGPHVASAREQNRIGLDITNARPAVGVAAVKLLADIEEINSTLRNGIRGDALIFPMRLATPAQPEPQKAQSGLARRLSVIFS